VSEDLEIQLLVETGQIAVGRRSEQLVAEVHQDAAVGRSVIGGHQAVGSESINQLERQQP
jgi:hypothetical protein